MVDAAVAHMDAEALAALVSKLDELDSKLTDNEREMLFEVFDLAKQARQYEVTGFSNISIPGVDIIVQKKRGSAITQSALAAIGVGSGIVEDPAKIAKIQNIKKSSEDR